MDIAKALANIDRVKKITAIKKQYLPKMKRRKNDNRPYVYINRKQIIAGSDEELFNKLYDLIYGFETFTIFKLFPMYISYKQECTPAKGLTLKKYINDFKKFFLPYEGTDILDKPFIELTSRDYIRLFDRWTASREINSRQFNNLKTIINGIYKYVITELDLKAVNRIRDIDMRQFPMKPTRHKDRAFTLEEREQILQYLSDKDDPVSLALVFDFYTGLRVGELLALKFSDIENGILTVNGQYLKDVNINDDLTSTPIIYSNTDMVKGYTDKGFRCIPLNEAALRIIKKMKLQNPFGKYIFMKNGKQLHPNTCGSRLRRICLKFGFEPRGTHSIRFTYASLLYRNGIPVLNISKLLGHTNVIMTNRYINDIMPNEELNELVKKAL